MWWTQDIFCKKFSILTNFTLFWSDLERLIIGSWVLNSLTETYNFRPKEIMLFANAVDINSKRYIANYFSQWYIANYFSQLQLYACTVLMLILVLAKMSKDLHPWQCPETCILKNVQKSNLYPWTWLKCYFRYVLCGQVGKGVIGSQFTPVWLRLYTTLLGISSLIFSSLSKHMQYEYSGFNI